MAAVEFALILPIMVVLWIGGVELTQGLSIDRRINNLDSAVGDLVARRKTIAVSDISAIFAIAPGAMFPYSSTGIQMRVTAVSIDGSQNGKVTWSCASGTTTYTKNQTMNTLVPATLRVANTQIIMSEVFYTYKPAVGYTITGNINLNDRMYFVPRLVDAVPLTGSGSTCVS